MTRVAGCPRCDQDGGGVVVRAERWRIVRAAEPGFPAFYRLVWNDHVPEFSDLPSEHRNECMEAVVAIERAMRSHLQPVKVNLATLGNVVPHLHWHVIGRYGWDSRYPAPAWAAEQRTAPADRLRALEARLPRFEEELGRTLGRPAG